MKKCSLCGEKALEGIEICPECLKKAAVDPKQIKRLRQISNILSITADTDTNIKACMQSITEIADDLERGKFYTDTRYIHVIRRSRPYQYRIHKRKT
jgi:hypothetical protein